jgi:OOP family OmpA-OmpF porin
MIKNHVKLLVLVMVAALLAGCAASQVKSTGPLFDPYQFSADQYESKVDNFLVILDASSSMAERYDGSTKFVIAKSFLQAMNETIPALEINGALRTFGHHDDVSKEKSVRFYGLAQYSRNGFASALEKVGSAGGTSPLVVAINAAGSDLASSKGKTAVIVVSDGKDMGYAPVVAADNLKKKFGARVCIYTVLVGDDPAGKKLLESVAVQASVAIHPERMGSHPALTWATSCSRCF